MTLSKGSQGSPLKIWDALLFSIVEKWGKGKHESLSKVSLSFVLSFIYSARETFRSKATENVEGKFF